MSARQRKPSVQTSNVVPMPRRPTETEAIVATVTGESRRQRATISQGLREALDALEVRHRAHAQQLVGIGVQMDRPTLDDFIEVGRRLLAAKGARA